MRPLTVGGELDSYCGKCKMVLRHRIVAMVDNQPKRVRCLTCNQEHNHRSLKPKDPTPKVRTPKKSAAKSTTKAGAWALHMAQWDADRVKPYNVFQTFAVHDFVVHTTFGRGVVTDIPSPDKIIALFENGEKMLIQGRMRG
ncbi:MAG: hypothetical protein H6510_01345 [Acidobacteria bacterium]|nr:hypothetical protein [Acidobacteriota bacterium]MCB9396435.1 hypothetical protein [Acidobacteriota bacterium]